MMPFLKAHLKASQTACGLAEPTLYEKKSIINSAVFATNI